jgi:hypothetical protein
MRDWVKTGVEFIKALAGQGKSSSHPSTPSDTADSTAAGEDLTLAANSSAARAKSQTSIRTKGSPNQQEVQRRRELVRQFFNDFWMSTDEKPATFAERLNRAEGHINERLAARGETWQLDAATRKELRLPPPETV